MIFICMHCLISTTTLILIPHLLLFPLPFLFFLGFCSNVKSMATPEILLKFLKTFVFVAVMMVGTLDSSVSIVIVRFHRTPPEQSRFSTAVFEYSAMQLNGTNVCKSRSCHFSCQLDGQTLLPCPADFVELKNLRVNHKHTFQLDVTTRDGERNSSSYSWFIDTVPPTATIFSANNYTNAGKMSIDVTFTEACMGLGGFKCVNSSNCDVLLDGPGYVQPSSLRSIKANMKYRLDIILTSERTNGRVVIRMAEEFCTDKAGNLFTRTNASVLVIHFDRRPVLVDLWMPVPSYLLKINGVSRTVFSTNSLEHLNIFLDFNVPVRNSSQEVLNSLRVNSGSILPTLIRNHANRKFVFELKNVSSTEIITVELASRLIIGRSGNPASSVAPLTILYDSKKPEVGLSTSAPNVTKVSAMDVIVEFTKPVFGFEASMVQVEGGKVTRFKEHSRALYSLTVVSLTEGIVSISIPEGKVNDISGNKNLASNQLGVKHYSIPAISIALHSFVTAGVLATSLAAASLSLSSANLGAISTLSSENTGKAVSSPSMNLHGLFGHLQVFVLSDWLSPNHPIEYSETTKGLQWLIPRQKLPWKKDCSSIWPNHVHLAQESVRSLSLALAYHEKSRDQLDTNLTVSSNGQLTGTHPNFNWLHGYDTTMKSTSYGLPLDPAEYFTYFLRGEPFSAGNVVRRLVNYNGWQDLEMNLFWLAVGGGCLLIIHVLILLFVRRRTGTPAHGILSVPRFELLLLILMLPCISQSSAFVIRGGTMGGIITGALLLVIPAALILSVCLFLAIAIFSGSIAQYKEIRHVSISEPWYTKVLFFFIGWPVAGKWFYKEGLPSSFLQRFGILFENIKGPPLYVFIDQNDMSSMPKLIESSRSGIGRMRAVSSDDSMEETKMPLPRRLIGCARSSYIVLDLLRRVFLGIIPGVYSSQSSSQSLLALAITLIQFIYLFTFKPYIRRRVHVVESISLSCELGIFGISFFTYSSNPIKARALGYIMLALLFVTFIAQVINEWYALMTFLQRLSHPQKNSFKLGLKFAARGLVLPFLPRRHWSRAIASSSHQPKTGIPSVAPLSPEAAAAAPPHADPLSSMTATVVPVLTHGSPDLNAYQATSSTAAETRRLTGPRAGEGRRIIKGEKLENKTELKKLRELAKATFSGD